MLYYDRTFSELMLIKEAHQRSVIFVTNGVFYIKGLIFNQFLLFNFQSPQGNFLTPVK